MPYLPGIYEIAVKEESATLTHWLGDTPSGEKQVKILSGIAYDYDAVKGENSLCDELEKCNLERYMKANDMIARRYVVNRNNLSNYQEQYGDVIVVDTKDILDQASTVVFEKDKSDTFIGTGDMTVYEFLDEYYQASISTNCLLMISRTF